MGEWGLNLVPTLSPTHCVTLAKPFPSSASVSFCVKWGFGEILINPHSEPHKGRAFVPPFHRKETRLGEASWTTTARQGARQGLNLGPTSGSAF